MGTWRLGVGLGDNLFLAFRAEPFRFWTWELGLKLSGAWDMGTWGLGGTWFRVGGNFSPTWQLGV